MSNDPTFSILTAEELEVLAAELRGDDPLAIKAPADEGGEEQQARAPKRLTVEDQKTRRERIATQVLGDLLPILGPQGIPPANVAAIAVRHAAALAEELDREPKA